VAAAHQTANWASGVQDIEIRPAGPTDYDLLLEHLGMTQAPLILLAEDPAIQSWVHSHKNKRYVPESLLHALGEKVVAEGWE
jgi:hypothetical protein